MDLLAAAAAALCDGAWFRSMVEGRAAEQAPPPQPASSRASMDLLAALLRGRLPPQLSATELHFRIALLRDAVNVNS